MKTKERVEAEKKAVKDKNGSDVAVAKKENEVQKQASENEKNEETHVDCIFYGCRKCNFDVCPSCIEKARQLSKNGFVQ